MRREKVDLSRSAGLLMGCSRLSHNAPQTLSTQAEKHRASTGYGFVRPQSVTRRGPDTSVHRTSISVIVRCSGSSQLPSCGSRTHPRPQVLSEPVGIVRNHVRRMAARESRQAREQLSGTHAASAGRAAAPATTLAVVAHRRHRPPKLCTFAATVPTLRHGLDEKNSWRAHRCDTHS